MGHRLNIIYFIANNLLPIFPLWKSSFLFGQLDHSRLILTELFQGQIFNPLWVPERRLTQLLKVDSLLLTFWRFNQEAIGMNQLCIFFSINTALDFFGSGEGEVGRGALHVYRLTLMFSNTHAINIGLFLHRTSQILYLQASNYRNLSRKIDSTETPLNMAGALGQDSLFCQLRLWEQNDRGRPYLQNKIIYNNPNDDFQARNTNLQN